MGKKAVSEELTEIGKKLKKLLMTPFPENVNDSFKKELRDTIAESKRLQKKQLEETRGHRPTSTED